MAVRDVVHACRCRLRARVNQLVWILYSYNAQAHRCAPARIYHISAYDNIHMIS